MKTLRYLLIVAVASLACFAQAPVAPEPACPLPAPDAAPCSDDCGKTWNAIGGGAGVSVTGDEPVTTFFTDNFGNPAKGKVARTRSSDGHFVRPPTFRSEKSRSRKFKEVDEKFEQSTVSVCESRVVGFSGGTRDLQEMPIG